MTQENCHQSASLETSATGLLPRHASARGRGQPGRSGPPGNSNARKHGAHTLKKAVKVLGNRVISRRTKVGRALAAWREDLIRDLGGDPSTAQRAVIELALRTKLLLDSIDAWLLTQPSLVNARKRALLPVVRERQGLADALARYLGLLGLERRIKSVPDLTTYLAARAGRDVRTAPTGGEGIPSPPGSFEHSNGGTRIADTVDGIP